MKTYFASKLNYLSNLLSLDLAYFIKGGFWAVLSLACITLSGIFLSSAFSRYWPSEVFGKYSLLISMYSLISAISFPGMNQMVTQSVSEKNDGTYQEVIKVVFKWSLLSSLVILLVSFYFLLLGNTEFFIAGVASTLIFPISSATGYFGAFLLGKKYFQKMAVFNTFSVVIPTLITLIVLIIFQNLLLVFIFSILASAIVNILLTYLTFKDLDNHKIDMKAINFGVHLSVSQLFVLGSEYLDRFLIPFFLGYTNNAIYTFAILIPNQIHALLKTILNIGQPKVAQASDKDFLPQMLKKSLLFSGVVMVMILVYILSAPWIFDFLYPSYKSSALFPSQVFALSLVYFPTNLFGFGFIKYRQTRVIYLINCSYPIVSLLFLIFLIPIYGLLGAVIAKILIRIIYGLSQTILFIYFTSKKSVTAYEPHI